MSHIDGPDWFLRLTVPSDLRYVNAVCELAGLITERAHCGREEAAQICRSVEAATEKAVTSSPGNGRGIEVWFEKRARQLDVGMRFADPRGAAGGPFGWPDDAQGASGSQAPALERTTVERARGVVECRLSCRLPGA